MRLLLVGNYGAGNLGDEALRDFFLTRFPQHVWTCISVRPSRDRPEVPPLPCGLRSLCTTPWWRTFMVLWRVDAVVFGGGSLFTDTESVFACMLWWWHAMVARFLRKPLHFAFQGVGPFRTRLGEWLARSAFRKARSLSVRDTLSFSRVQLWHLNTKVIQSFDPVFSLVDKEKTHTNPQNVLTVIPRHNSRDSLLSRLKELLLGGMWDGVDILLLQPEHPQERSFALELLSAGAREIIPVRTLEELVDQVAASRVVLTQRYHGGLVALALQRELHCVEQSPGDKLDALAKLAARPFDREVLCSQIEDGVRALEQGLRS
ncbi:hypothetical protein COU80_03580 [Candidatus Peregrinibacteria bacterium CG10_big_fil_rev_8_21_14_0_10_55_24]|nr:MAG: hypothetical protein COU80_03580 [Candidatus Peregrinibacteria bacterium CG10_big_fil_rev_8_21_14_0_10_55_24]